MMAGNRIAVPDYQRAYSWETPGDGSERSTHTDVYISDLERHAENCPDSPYYFGHFLFESKENRTFYVIDGQQRLTTIVIFLSAIFARIRMLRPLSEQEEVLYEDLIRRRSENRFSTVEYDKQLFIDYVIERAKTDPGILDTVSKRRIVRASDFFTKHITEKSETYLTRMLAVVAGSTCTTHIVRTDSDAIQMFIFQNNRGKRPSNLEIVKAQFMYQVHLHGDDARDPLIEEIKSRFEQIYKSISSIEDWVDEDAVLIYTLRVFYNDLNAGNPLDRIDKSLSGDDPIPFIKGFSFALSQSFECLSRFFGPTEQANPEMHSLVTLGGIALAFPFLIKAYAYGVETDDRRNLCSALEKVLIRDRVIGTRADLGSRLQDVFRALTKENKEISPILARVEWMLTCTDWWWSYWNNESFEQALRGPESSRMARHLLWKYENHLLRNRSKAGYNLMRMDQIESPEVEHIAPQTEPALKPHGYGEYDEEFKGRLMNSLGNLLLLSKSHNCSIGNHPFPVKHRDYTYLEQQREVQSMVPNPECGIWNRNMIESREDKIVRFLLAEC